MITFLYYLKYYIQIKKGIPVENRCFEKAAEFYFKYVPFFGFGVNRKKRKRKVIISLTTIPERIDKVWLTIESLLRQTYKADEIILWLADEEFDGHYLTDRLLAQKKRGLTIRYCDNLKSYKKFYYTMKENRNSFVVTVDDDVIYAETMLGTMLRTYQQNPGCVICNRSHQIRNKGNELLPYNRWKAYEKRNMDFGEPSFRNFFTGCGGTLFPVYLLDKRIIQKEVFLEKAPEADDVWLNLMCWVSGLKIKNTDGILGNIISIEENALKGLSRINVNRQKNDLQLKQVLEYLEINVKDYL